MQTQLADAYKSSADGQAAEAILRKCVHCGFCTATCPTYQLLGDELDGPRGRIYLIKQVFEGTVPTRATQQHLDRCLTCRNCETTCPSGVHYGALLDLGRRAVEAQVPRPRRERLTRWALREGLTSALFAPALALGQWLRPLVPGRLKDKVPVRAGREAHRWPTRSHPRKVLLLTGCVQPALAPNINSATARVLDACGVQTLVAEGAGCCGAIREHLCDHEGALADMRRNIDAWWPLIDPPGGDGTPKVEALVMNASGCGVTVKAYGEALKHDPAYADKARRVSALTRDLGELMPALLPKLKLRLGVPAARGVRPAGTAVPLAYHPPCTLQHGQQLRGGVEQVLRELGYEVRLPATESHLCCGSAGTYSVLQPELSKQLRERKLAQLDALEASVIVSANIGCIQHLQAGTATRVRHWVEVIDAALEQ
jgi:glycolate oxidase iron-sulfur subunit